MNRPLSSEFAEIQRWAITQGFRVEDGRTATGKTSFPVTWQDIQLQRHTTEVEDLTELPQFINQLIESGQAKRPDTFYTTWIVSHLDDSYWSDWCRTRSWIHVIVFEGAPYSRSHCFDPTPYASAQEAVDSVAFLPLELGARLQFYAYVHYLTDNREFIPTASYSREAVEEQILDVVRHCAYRRLRWYACDVDYVANQLQEGIALPWEKSVPVVNELIAAGRLVREWEQERFWGKRWLKRLWNRRRMCLSEPGWKCRLIPCENCGGTARAPDGRYCPYCAGEGKVAQWQQK